MILFHGSNVEITEVDLSKCGKFKDFGTGFYTTTLEDQAWRMAKRRTVLEGCGVPTVTLFEVPDDLVGISELNCRVFDEQPSIEWAIFIKNNRDRHYSDSSSRDCNTDCKYDVVVGPVADDTVGLLIRQFSRGTIDAEYLKREFSFDRLTNQYTFHTEKALCYLKKVGVLYE